MGRNRRVKINKAEYAGFCFGVKRAIDIALSTVKKNKNVVMLGDIVHNEKVVNKLKQLGIKPIKKLSKGEGKTLIIQAHGMPRRIINKIRRKGYKIVDATCPMVYHIHKIARQFEKEQRKIIIVGDKNHTEVKGIIGNLHNKPVIVENIKEAHELKISPKKKIGVVVQSTRNLEETKTIFNILQQKFNDIKLANTICNITRKKQNEIQTMPKRNDVMIVVGSKKSANTKRLYEISQTLNKNTYWINSPRQLRKIWFRKAQNIGVTSGASTPDEITEAVISRIKKLTS